MTSSVIAAQRSRAAAIVRTRNGFDRDMVRIPDHAEPFSFRIGDHRPLSLIDKDYGG